ncbi:NAD(P)-binding protein [Massarina eburnea CBS 473.64]|uniref:NAD(P)-binding protein n=1 Tax=Massarina eburnea CBS 473.64 TaxID=1395130 RepID=A0A6A6S9U3_9PLEO|nr:NAD(P)-binding protein [Massarina eburnea CBS 473.64]
MSLFNGKVILITGAASGIGLATARNPPLQAPLPPIPPTQTPPNPHTQTDLLAKRAATLSLADINEPALSQTERSIRATYPSVQILSYIVDVREEEQVRKWVELSMRVFGRIDGAANMAGVIGPSIGLKPLTHQSIPEWTHILSINLTGLMLCLKHQLRHMCAGGSIVNASSIAGLQGRRNNAAYSTSKHAVLGLTRSAAKESGPRNIRVNAICPGYIKTPMNAASHAIAASASTTSPNPPSNTPSTSVSASASVIDPRTRESEALSVALGRSGQAGEVAELICYLLGEGASFMTGNAVSVDGGWNC